MRLITRGQGSWKMCTNLGGLPPGDRNRRPTPARRRLATAAGAGRPGQPGSKQPERVVPRRSRACATSSPPPPPPTGRPPSSSPTPAAAAAAAPRRHPSSPSPRMGSPHRWQPQLYFSLACNFGSDVSTLQGDKEGRSFKRVRLRPYPSSAWELQTKQVAQARLGSGGRAGGTG